ncbi:MAG: radical SAM protein [Verrucomicrobiota bacterium]
MSIALTNACDLSCAYCFAPKTRAALDFERVVQWLRELDANGCLGVGFGGGEPTLYRRLTDLCRYAARETTLAVTFTTHAHNLNKDSVLELAGTVHFVRVSMDGIGETYERLRGRSFAELRRSIQRIAAIAPFGINYVVNSDTLLDLDRAVDFAEAAGAKQFLLLPEHPSRNSHGIDVETSSALRSWVFRYGGKVPLAISEGGAEGLPVSDPLASECGLRGYAHIDASGVLKKTSYQVTGVPIDSNGVMTALTTLVELERRSNNEDLE